MQRDKCHFEVPLLQPLHKVAEKGTLLYSITRTRINCHRLRLRDALFNSASCPFSVSCMKVSGKILLILRNSHPVSLSLKQTVVFSRNGPGDACLQGREIFADLPEILVRTTCLQQRENCRTRGRIAHSVPVPSSRSMPSPFGKAGPRGPAWAPRDLSRRN